MPTPKILLETPRLWLRSMQPDAVDALLYIFSDPKVMAAFDVPPFNRDQMMQWVHRSRSPEHAWVRAFFGELENEWT
jgi:hypothetical protein